MKKLFRGLLWLFIFFPLLRPQESPPVPQLRSGNIVGNIGIQKIPFTLFGHKIYLKIRINDSRELDFVLDTGALTAVNREIAQELGVEEGLALPSITKSGGIGV